MPRAHARRAWHRRDGCISRRRDFLAVLPRGARAVPARARRARGAHLSAPGRALPRLRLRRALRGAARSRRSPEPRGRDAARPGGAAERGRASPPSQQLAAIRPATRDRHHAADAGSSGAAGTAADGGADRRHRYELLPPEPKRGFGLLPAPSPGDIFFDIEGYPFFEPSRGLEYLWGVTSRRDAGLALPRRSSASIARARSARSRRSSTSCMRAAEDLSRPARLSLRRVRNERDQAADGRARHARGGGGRPAAPRRVRRSLSGRPPVDADFVRQLLAQEGARVLHGRRRRRARSPKAASRSSSSSASSKPATKPILDAIRDYNAEDCESTRLLRDWLLERKAEAERSSASTIPWYVKPQAPRRRPRNATINRDLRERLATLAARATAARDPVRRGQPPRCSRISSTITAARRSQDGGPSSIG